jgi:hypothetical protein
VPDRKLRFGRAGSGPLRMSASGTEGGDGCGWWQAPVADRFANRLRPLCLADWYDVPSTFRHWGLIVVSPRSLTNTSIRFLIGPGLRGVGPARARRLWRCRNRASAAWISLNSRFQSLLFLHLNFSFPSQGQFATVRP